MNVRVTPPKRVTSPTCTWVPRIHVNRPLCIHCEGGHPTLLPNKRGCTLPNVRLNTGQSYLS